MPLLWYSVAPHSALGVITLKGWGTNMEHDPWTSTAAVKRHDGYSLITDCNSACGSHVKWSLTAEGISCTNIWQIDMAWIWNSGFGPSSLSSSLYYIKHFDLLLFLTWEKFLSILVKHLEIFECGKLESLHTTDAYHNTEKSYAESNTPSFVVQISYELSRWEWVKSSCVWWVQLNWVKWLINSLLQHFVFFVSLNVKLQKVSKYNK